MRVKIWGMALPTSPRLVPVSFDSRCHNLRTTVKPPTLLSVCAESRTEASKIYTPAFALDGYFQHSTSQVVPFNFENDTLFILSTHYNRSAEVGRFLKSIDILEGEKVLHVALASSLCYSGIQLSRTFTNMLPKVFPNLVSLSFLNDKVNPKGDCNHVPGPDVVRYNGWTPVMSCPKRAISNWVDYGTVSKTFQ